MECLTHQEFVLEAPRSITYCPDQNLMALSQTQLSSASRESRRTILILPSASCFSSNVLHARVPGRYSRINLWRHPFATISKRTLADDTSRLSSLRLTKCPTMPMGRSSRFRSRLCFVEGREALNKLKLTQEEFRQVQWYERFYRIERGCARSCQGTAKIVKGTIAPFSLSVKERQGLEMVRQRVYSQDTELALQVVVCIHALIVRDDLQNEDLAGSTMLAQAPKTTHTTVGQFESGLRLRACPHLRPMTSVSRPRQARHGLERRLPISSRMSRALSSLQAPGDRISA